MTRILLVCMGNLCRSPIAEAIATRMAIRRGLTRQVQLASAGTHPLRRGETADPRAIRVGLRRGYDLSMHRTRRVVPADFANFDLILAMDENNLAALRQTCPPEQSSKLLLFLDALGDPALTEVPDPYFGSVDGFERVFDLCEAGLEAIFKQYRDFRN